MDSIVQDVLSNCRAVLKTHCQNAKHYAKNLWVILCIPLGNISFLSLSVQCLCLHVWSYRSPFACLFPLLTLSSAIFLIIVYSHTNSSLSLWLYYSTCTCLFSLLAFSSLLLYDPSYIPSSLYLPFYIYMYMCNVFTFSTCISKMYCTHRPMCMSLINEIKYLPLPLYALNSITASPLQYS